MFTPSAKPVIFLAFANDRAQAGDYLRNLGREADSLRASLQQAADLCEVIERHSVTPEQILQLFLFTPSTRISASVMGIGRWV